jgi:8-oxo-dGTP pyrophosphatase MutT (NUDIX family)
MSYDLNRFLQGQTAVSTTHPTWQWQTYTLSLCEQTYLCPTLPPDELISSARVILLRGDEVMVIQDHQNKPYIIPGGRREPGETILQTLHREIGEETGWTVRDTAVIGFTHFQHLTPRPDGYPYPHPHFFWAIFAAQADQYDPTRLKDDFYVASANFHPIRDVLTWQLGYGQHELLQTAVQQKNAA